MDCEEGFLGEDSCFFFGADSSSFGGSRLDISSPSSARRAMVLPIGTFFAPFWTYDRVEQREAEPKCIFNHQYLAHDTIIGSLYIYRCLVRFLLFKSQCQRWYTRAIRNERTISSKTSPDSNESPSFTFHCAIPPSVIVGDIAGIANFDTACRMLLRCNSAWRKVDFSLVTS